MWHYFPRGPLENRVLKTRFIIQKNFKNLQVPSTASPHRIGSDQRETQIRERETKSERGRPDQRERNSQIREGEKEIAWVAHLGRVNPGRAPGFPRPGSRDPGAAPGSREPRPRDPDLFLSLSDLIISLSLIWSPSL